MDRNQIRAGVDFVREVLQYHSDRLAAGHTETDADTAAWDDGVRFIDEQSALVRRLDERDQQLARAGEFLTTHPEVPTTDGDGSRHVPNFTPGDRTDPFDTSNLSIASSPAEIRGQARTAIERMDGDDAAKEAATATLDRAKAAAGEVGLRYLLTGSDTYASAFTKLIGNRGHALTADESTAIDRAASLTDSAGGYAVPFLVDPTIVLTGSGSANPFRSISRVVQGVSDTWNGINSGGVTAQWTGGEAQEVTDGSPTLTQPSIPAHKADCFVPFSIEIGQDWASIEADLRDAMIEAKDDLEATAFATGSGTNRPTGIVTALVASSPTVLVTSIAGDTFAKADVYAVQAALGAKYRSRAQWVANLLTQNLIRAFGTTDDAFTINMNAEKLMVLLGQAIHESTAMDGVISAGAENYMLAYGDWSNYVIYDRIGMSVELVPHLFGTGNNRPTGQRGFYAHWRVGADCRNDNAFRLLNVT